MLLNRTVADFLASHPSRKTALFGSASLPVTPTVDPSSFRGLTNFRHVRIQENGIQPKNPQIIQLKEANHHFFSLFNLCLVELKTLELSPEKKNGLGTSWHLLVTSKAGVLRPKSLRFPDFIGFGTHQLALNLLIDFQLLHEDSQLILLCGQGLFRKQKNKKQQKKQQLPTKCMFHIHPFLFLGGENLQKKKTTRKKSNAENKPASSPDWANPWLKITKRA